MRDNTLHVRNGNFYLENPPHAHVMGSASSFKGFQLHLEMHCVASYRAIDLEKNPGSLGSNNLVYHCTLELILQASTYRK
jgi:hypothetical protein